MLIPKQDMPENYIHYINPSPNTLEKYPLYLKEYGFGNDKKLSFGLDRSYSDILILYSYSGVTRFSKHTSTKFIQPHHIIISACNTPLYFSRSSAAWEYFYIIVSGSYTKLFYNLIRTKNNVLTINPLTNILSNFIEFANMDINAGEKFNMDACLLIHMLFHELYEVTFDVAKAKTYTPVQETDINNALKYIAANYKHDLTIDKICQEVNLSKYYFCKIFTAHIGIPVHKYLNEYRVNKSKELLTYSKLSINAISSEVGFNNSLTYIRCFKDSMHMTPTEYRNNF
ncbi:MAG: AraC family transcriptional regulator [Hespellia sp.]|nr:AraC family transcriptional regulator [Hespellia sp.]